MNLHDGLLFAARALAGHRRRTVLSLLGVAIGVAAVVLLVSLGTGAREYVSGQFASLGANLLIVVPGKTETTGALPGVGKPPNDLTLADAEALRRRVPGVRLLAPLSMGNETVAHGERSRQTAVAGSTHELLEVRDLAVQSGRFLPEGTSDRGSPVAVLGPKLARELFPEGSPIGGVVRIGDWRMRVIGVLAPQGTHLGLDMDEMALVPVATGLRMFDQRSLFRILMKTSARADLDAARRAALAVLAERHGEEDVTVFTQDAVVGSLSSILDVLTLALAGIAAISLTVAGIGIMNVMLVSVSERTREVGLLKALGARRSEILGVFLAEALLLSGAGGVLGLAGSAAAVRALHRFFPAVPDAPPGWAAAAALGLSVVVGTVFGLLPARRAARLEPVAALRGR